MQIPDAAYVTTAPKPPGAVDPAAADRAPSGEDLAALITRVLEEQGKTQKDLAAAAEVSYQTLNAWVNRTRGTSRIAPEVLRRIAEALRRFGADITPREVFESTGRRIPGPTDQEREARLLGLYRALPTDSQRALIQMAEAMSKAARVS